jgi:SAM-dependent methyltransferase
MDENPRTRRATVFGGVAEIYERSRPGYPDEAVRWLLGRGADTILELGAGTGQLTSSLVADGHRVVATDPEPRMLKPLRKRLKGVRRVDLVQARAERIPVRSYSVDAVVVAHAFHWFDHDLALGEIARVLRPGGTLGLCWNDRDERIDWVRRFGAILHDGDRLHTHGSPQHLSPDPGPAFEPLEEAAFRWSHHLPTADLRDLAASRSFVLTLPDDERAELLQQVDDLVVTHPDLAGASEVAMPYVTAAYRARRR